MPKIKGESKVPLQFRVDPKDAEDLAFFVKFMRGKTEADLLRDALSMYLDAMRREYAKRADLQLEAYMTGGPKMLYCGSPQKPQKPKRIGPGRNAPCPCGSGLKYKKCCLGTDEFLEQVDEDLKGHAKTQPGESSGGKSGAIDIDVLCT